MAIRNIVMHDDDILFKKCKKVIYFDDKLRILLDDMKETMYKNDGVGLAAPQVGILKRVVIIDDEETYLELINPEKIKEKGLDYNVEGCLSYPNEFGMVERPLSIEVSAFNRYGKNISVKASGLLARIICHEMDHLNGIVFKSIAKEFLTPKQAMKRMSKR